MKRKVRNTMMIISLLLFPITMNYLSPYVSIDGAIQGLVTGSLLVFFALFLSGMVLGRSWCGWLCPMGSLSDICLKSNARNVNFGKMRIFRYSVFGLWAVILLAMFALSGGIRGISPLHLTESGISVDAPMKYIVYCLVVFLFLLLTLLLGKRGACQSICWIAPFLTAGYHVGRFLRLPQLRIVSQKENCVSCGACEKACPMSLPVGTLHKSGAIRTSDCILCGECVDACKRKTLGYKIVRKS